MSAWASSSAGRATDGVAAVVAQSPVRPVVTGSIAAWPATEARSALASQCNAGAACAPVAPRARPDTPAARTVAARRRVVWDTETFLAGVQRHATRQRERGVLARVARLLPDVGGQAVDRRGRVLGGLDGDRERAVGARLDAGDEHDLVARHAPDDADRRARRGQRPHDAALDGDLALPGGHRRDDQPALQLERQRELLADLGAVAHAVGPPVG